MKRHLSSLIPFLGRHIFLDLERVCEDPWNSAIRDRLSAFGADKEKGEARWTLYRICRLLDGRKLFGEDL